MFCYQESALALLLAAEPTLSHHSRLAVRRSLCVKELAHASRVVVLVRFVTRVYNVIVGRDAIVARTRLRTAVVAVVFVCNETLKK